MPEGTVTLPGGAKIKKNVAIGLGVAGVGIAGYYLYRSRQANAANAATTATDSTTGNIDPQTGYAYGSLEDQAALNSMTAAGYGGSYPGFGQGGGTIGNTPGPTGFTSNSQWTQAAEAFMGSTGADTIAAALGKYLLGQPMSSDQVTVVQQAIAAEGYPPVPGPDGFPPSYKTVSGPTPPGHGPPAKNPVKGLMAEPRFTQIDVHWEPLTNATDYLVRAYLGSRMVSQEKVTGTFATLHDLKAGTSYRITVWGQPGTGGNASVTATTKK